jgi:hypothetical protein
VDKRVSRYSSVKEQVVRKVIEAAPEAVAKEKGAEHLLTSVTSFIGGGGPRFWFSIAPEATQTNYAQVIVQVRDKEATPKLIGPLQGELNKQVPGAWITVRQLQTNPVETPVEVLITGQADTDPRTERKRGYPIPSGNRVASRGYRSTIAWNCRVEGRLEPRQPTDENRD